MSKFIDLTGQRFGRLLVLGFDKKDRFRQFMWLCKCDCGNVVSVRGYSLRSGNTQSCGCLQKETNVKLRWAVTSGYDDDLTIDRVDVNGNYEPSNCRWLTINEQQLNTRRNHNISFYGITKTLKEWAADLGINHSTLLERLERWRSVEEALTIPKGGKQKWG